MKTKLRITLLVLLTVGVAIVSFALVSRAQETTTTRPSEETVSPTSRPTGNFNNRRQFRNNRRFNQRNENETSSAPATLPQIYEVVSVRNIFLKGNQRPPPVPPPSAPVQYSGIYTPAANQLVLTGVALEDNEKIAFLEDQQAFTYTRVKIGDPISTGKVINITFDALDYKDGSGKTIRVEVGFNLAGGDVWGTSAAPSTGGPTTQPASSAPRLPGESMEDYLRRRRAAETKH